MVKNSSSSSTPGEPMKTRNKSNTQERRNSVSDITEYFNKGVQPTNKTNQVKQKTTPSTTKTKEKEKAKEKEKDKKASPSIMSQTNAQEQNGGKTIEASDHDQEMACTDTVKGDAQQDERGDKNAKECKDNSSQTSEDLTSEAIKEIKLQLARLEEDLHHPKNGISNQVAGTSAKVQDLYSEIHGAVSGLKIRMDKAEKANVTLDSKLKQFEIGQNRMATLLDENKRLRQELQIMQGLVQKVNRQVELTDNKVLDLTKRGMEQNLILHGVSEKLEIEDSKAEMPMFKPKERCKHSALQFLQDILKVNVETEDIWKAHRIGQKYPDKVRPIVIKVSYAAKELIMEHVGALKDLKNPETKQPYFINEQLPEGVLETRKQTSARLKTLRDNNDKKPQQERSKIQVINDAILIDGEMDKPPIQTPQPSQLFLDVESQTRVDQIQQKLFETDPKIVRNSEFIAIAVKVHTLQEMKDAYIAVSQRYPSVDHNIAGYAFKDKEDGKLYIGSCDDREYGAGNRVKDTIFEEQIKNTAVFVLRKYGGIHLGFSRFTVIKDMAKQAIQLLKQSF